MLRCTHVVGRALALGSVVVRLVEGGAHRAVCVVARHARARAPAGVGERDGDVECVRGDE